MIDNKEFNVRYFNGNNAISENGVARVTGSSFLLNTSNQNLKFPFDSFHQVEMIHRGIKLTLHSDENKESPIIELFCEQKEAREIERRWISHKKGSNVSQSIGLFFRNLNPIPIIFGGMLFIFIFGLSFFFILQKVYVFFPEEVDEKMGNIFDQNIQNSFPICNSTEVDHFFSLALKALRPQESKFNYSVKVINLKEENAISLAGGRIYFFSGLLQTSSSQDEILGVLAHEISHVEKRHHLRSMIKALGTSFAISVLVGPGLGDFQNLETLTEIGSTIAVLKYSRDFETEADQYSYDILEEANLDASGLLQFLKRIHAEEQLPKSNFKSNEKKNVSSKMKDNLLDLLSSHPPTENRIVAAQNDLKSRKRKQIFRNLVSQKEWNKIKTSCKMK